MTQQCYVRSMHSSTFTVVILSGWNSILVISGYAFNDHGKELTSGCGLFDFNSCCGDGLGVQMQRALALISAIFLQLQCTMREQEIIQLQRRCLLHIFLQTFHQSLQITRTKSVQIWHGFFPIFFLFLRPLTTQPLHRVTTYKQTKCEQQVGIGVEEVKKKQKQNVKWKKAMVFQGDNNV